MRHLASDCSLLSYWLMVRLLSNRSGLPLSRPQLWSHAVRQGQQELLFTPGGAHSCWSAGSLGSCPADRVKRSHSPGTCPPQIPAHIECISHLEMWICTLSELYYLCDTRNSWYFWYKYSLRFSWTLLCDV